MKTSGSGIPRTPDSSYLLKQGVLTGPYLNSFPCFLAQNPRRPFVSPDGEVGELLLNIVTVHCDFSLLFFSSKPS
jgi:hypothetical protein